MKKKYVIIAVIASGVAYITSLSGFILDVVGKLAQTLKQSVVVSVIKSKLASLRPRFVPFAIKGRLVRDGAIISFLILFLTFLLSTWYLYRVIKLYRKKKTSKHFVVLAFLLFFLSFSLLGIIFSMFWLGEYLMYFSVGIESLIEKHV